MELFKMRRPFAKRVLPAFVILLVCAIAALSVFRACRERSSGRTSSKSARALAVQWRVTMAARPNSPCRCSGGWVVSDDSGGVTALSPAGLRVWHTSFSNDVFDAGAAVTDGLVVLASQQGHVFALRADTGEVSWSQTLEGCFQHAPLTGRVNNEAVLWLMSHSDGQLFCLRLRDGQIVWKSEPTNRSDGEPVAWHGNLAYGNCDGAVYVFDAANGRLKGSVAVGSDDQMAGGLLATDSGMLVAGTRQGNLALVNSNTLTLDALVSVSQSEAFVAPVEAFDDLIAMGTPEGEVVFSRIGEKQLRIARRLSAGAPVDRLMFKRGRLYALAGGSLCEWSSPDGPVMRLALGDDVSAVSAGIDGELSCVADRAVVCIRETIL